MIALLKILGIIGLILITAGILLKKRKTENILYIIGGLCLLAYSISIKDAIYILLQSIFVLAAIYNLVKNEKI